jgi:hypothetical protein
MAKIVCKPVGDDVYVDCDDGDLVPLEPREMGYDYAEEIVSTCTNVKTGGSIGIYFGSVLFSKIKIIIIIVIIIVIIITVIITVIILLCLFRYYCSSKMFN